jgi:arsenate-mycothiol transferase
MPDRPSVMFICVKNGGKSQMAAGLLRRIAGDRIDIYSAGTQPGSALNALSAQVLAEVGIDTSHESTKPIDPVLLESMTTVVTLGREARVDRVDGPRFEEWDTDEPSERGIDGIERMRLVRDDIAARVAILMDELVPPHAN